MIDFLRGLTLKTQWLKPIAYIVSFLSASLCVYIIFGKTGIAETDYYLIPSATALLWAITILIFLNAFPHAPKAADPAHGFFKRLGIRIKRFFYVVLAFLCCDLTLAVIFYSYKLLSIWLQSTY